MLIKYIEKNEAKSKDKNIYNQLINFLNDSVENELYLKNYIIKNKIKIQNAFFMTSILKKKRVCPLWKLMDILRF